MGRILQEGDELELPEAEGEGLVGAGVLEEVDKSQEAWPLTISFRGSFTRLRASAAVEG